MPYQTAILIGATGLVGSHVLKALQKEPDIGTIRVFGRRTVGVNMDKVEEHLIDFDKISEYASLITGDVLFSCLGTTLKAAGNKENQFKIDVTYQDTFAKIAARNGVQAYYLVSAPNANKNSTFFYSRIKGELEERINNYNFKIIRIFRPSVLTGHRQKERKGEKWAGWFMNNIGRFIPFIKRYKPISGADVAEAMITEYRNHSSQQHIVYELDEIFGLLE